MSNSTPQSGTTPATPARLRPAARLAGLTPYVPPPRDGESLLLLDANEGAPDADAMAAALGSISPEVLRRYPDAAALERELAAGLSIDRARVVVTNGGDDAIDRVCRSVVEPGRNAVLHAPTFEMIGRGVRLAGGEVRSMPWLGGPFPLGEYLEKIDTATALAALVTPNNPTGGAIAGDALVAVAERAAACGALVMVDLAYIEFADQDPTPRLLALENVVMIRTFSKAFGLAGLRVGYAIAPPAVAPWLRTVGGPYPVSTVSLSLAGRALGSAAWREAFLKQIGIERSRLTEVLGALGAETYESQANFVTARLTDANGVRERLADRGIRVRGFSNHPELSAFLRISLPGDTHAFARLTAALQDILKEGTR